MSGTGILLLSDPAAHADEARRRLAVDMKYYPVFMDIEGRECLVVGAGTVAARKARSLMECGARVTVIGENPVPSLRLLETKGLRIRPRRFRSGDMKDYALVFGATDDEKVNAGLSKLARRRGLPVNVADRPELCTFIVPSLYRRGDLSIAVSTGGKSPAAARSVREDLEKGRGREYAELVNLLGGRRERMMRSISGHRRRAALWRKIRSADLLGVLRRSGRRAAARLVDREITLALREERAK